MNEEICTKSVWVIFLGSEKLCSAGCHPLLDKPTRLMWQWRKILLLVRTDLNYRRQALMKKAEGATAASGQRTSPGKGTGYMRMS